MRSRLAWLRHLLDAASLLRAFESRSETALDDDSPLPCDSCPAAAASAALSATPAGDDAASDEARLLPSVESLGVNFSTSTLSLRRPAQSGAPGDGGESALFVIRLECYEVGGATCAGKFADAAAVAAAVAPCDVVVALYDLCDRESLDALARDILPAIAATTRERRIPIVVAGTKLDARKALAPNERGRCVLGPDQRRLDAALPPNAVAVSSVAARSAGAGVMRLRREVLYEAVRARKEQLIGVAVFSSPQQQQQTPSVWHALDGDVALLQRAVASTDRGSRAASPPAALGGAAAGASAAQSTGGADADPPVINAAAPTAAADGEKPNGDGKGVNCCSECVIC